MKKDLHVMIDLETMGSKPGCALASIGAVVFGRGKILDRYYKRIDVNSCIEVGLEMDWDTVKWWFRQSKEARLEIIKQGGLVDDVLSHFAAWCDFEHISGVWGNGSDFDNAILASAYAAIRHKLPWKFTKNRCYRTVKNDHLDVEMTHCGVHHNALADAESQAIHLMQIWGYDCTDLLTETLCENRTQEK